MTSCKVGLKNGHIREHLTKMVNPRDVAGDTEEEEDEDDDEEEESRKMETKHLCFGNKYKGSGRKGTKVCCFCWMVA